MIDAWGAQCETGKSSHLSTAGYHWLASNYTQNVFNTVAPPNYRYPTCIAGTTNPGFSSDRNGLYPARSRHPGGVNAAIADGSVNFISSTIDWLVYQGLGTRSGGESVSIQ